MATFLGRICFVGSMGTALGCTPRGMSACVTRSMMSCLSYSTLVNPKSSLRLISSSQAFSALATAFPLGPLILRRKLFLRFFHKSLSSSWSCQDMNVWIVHRKLFLRLFHKSLSSSWSCQDMNGWGVPHALVVMSPADIALDVRVEFIQWQDVIADLAEAEA